MIKLKTDESKVIRIDFDIYYRILKVKSKMEIEKSRPVSFSEALEYLLEKK